ncbi:MAG: XdhC family protein [Chitinophagaceae bacterium]
MHDAHLDKILELKAKQEPFAIAIVVGREAPSSGKAGDKAVIDRRGVLSGWIGGGCVKGIVLKESASAIQSGKPRLVRIGKHLQNNKIQEDVMEYKMTCQSEGTVEIFIEPVLPQPHLMVLGKSQIARALVKLARHAGFRITAVAPDANLQTFEKVDELITRFQLDQVKTYPNTFIVVATQGEQDELALSEALKKEYAYLGFVTSRKKMGSITSYLTDSGFAKEKIESIHAPAGIDINAKQADEVAISILAEMIQFKNSNVLWSSFQDKESAATGQNDTPQYYINPVCGIPVDMKNPKHIMEYNGETVYFCCDGCKIKFEKEPEKYIRAREMGLAPEGM